MDRWKGKVAVVTGASAGIGLEIAKVLLSEGMIVIGLARREEKMTNELKGVKGFENFYAKKCDITKENEVTEVFEYIENTFKTVHILINNAGSVKTKTIDDAETSELQEIVNVNFMGLLYSSKYAIKLMKKNDHEAHIINMNSVAGHKVINPNWFGNDKVNFNVYSPTKYAVTALSEVFTIELRGSKIRVTNLSPGYVLTDIITDEEREKTALANFPHLTTRDIADAVLYVVGAPPHVLITQLTIQPLNGTF